ncbi:MAG: deoxyribose-phosphate aldolase [Phycisphaerales bacterium]|nr:MAG: deoxyribose-phosphate aldolase [Phycisphaerales bacterium]
MIARPVDSVMLQQRAAALARRSIKGEAKMAGLRMALSMLDLTTLEGKDSPQKVKALCRKAIRPHDKPIDPPLPSVAAVCVYPAMVKIAREALAGSSVKVASVATAFPSGQFPMEVRLADVQRAVEDGADEIDMVINRGAFLSGHHDVVAEEIRKVKIACEHAHLKIILEVGELETYDNIRRASDLAIEAASCEPFGEALANGEVFIKTSTGKMQPAATPPAVLAMLEAIRDHYLKTGVKIGMKPAGGISTAKQALQYLVMVKETLGEQWLTPKLFRFGASSLANDLLRQIVKQTTGGYVAKHDFSDA